MNKSNKKGTSNSSFKKNDELFNLDKELKDLIDINENMKIGIEKIFNELEKKNNTNNSK